MELTSYFILGAFLILLTVFIIQIIGLRSAKSDFMGRASIVKIHFYCGKTALFTPWFFFIIKALKPNIGYVEPPVYLEWTSIVLLYIGVAGMALGLFALGLSLKIGLPVENSVLKTSGIYRLSRNPLYTSAIIIDIASCLYFPDLINITFTLYGIIVHHQIILGEEKYLKSHFGNDYDNYREKVRRYI
ncbi:MAG: isoprenylcysteine carboxylmethyltransferase family protein [Bacteroidota bacterium]